MPTDAEVDKVLREMTDSELKQLSNRITVEQYRRVGYDASNLNMFKTDKRSIDAPVPRGGAINRVKEV